MNKAAGNKATYPRPATKQDRRVAKQLIRSGINSFTYDADADGEGGTFRVEGRFEVTAADLGEFYLGQYFPQGVKGPKVAYSRPQFTVEKFDQLEDLIGALIERR
jgi:hypothetical protein